MANSERRCEEVYTFDFIARVAPGAKSAMKNSGILSSLTISQAILESDWGTHAPGNNLFGIKALGWTGRTQILRTTEYYHGKNVVINDVFRVYNSWTESIEDHACFLLRNPRYRNIIGVTDYKTACRRIQEDGYATSQGYSQQLINLITKYKLYRYDTLSPQTCIDTPIQGAVITGAITVSGWTVNFSGIERVDVYADGNRGLKSLKDLSDRPDVTEAINPFGWYKNTNRSGFSYVIPQGTLSRGNHAINCAGIGRDGSVMWETKSISIR